MVIFVTILFSQNEYKLWIIFKECQLLTGLRLLPYAGKGKCKVAMKTYGRVEV
jgi:hypothetical protein